VNLALLPSGYSKQRTLWSLYLLRHVVSRSGSESNLDVVSRVRECGILGASQVWKDLGNFTGKSPIYEKGIRKGEIFKSLGLLELYKKFVVEENLIPPRRSVYLSD